MNTSFRARVYKWIDHIIDIPEQLVYDFEDLCNELVALVVWKGFDLAMTPLVTNFVKI
jgi:hypothetical protein